MRRSVVFGLLASLVASAALAAPPPSPTVAIASGEVRGDWHGGVAGYLGLPYAAPPVGPLRWRAPQPVQPWSGLRDARQFGAPCAQMAMDWNRAVAGQSREDCLYLNVWVPPHRVGQVLPVLVFFPGGAYHGGSARGLSAIEPSYDGARLARRGVVVVTANYRLGMFGFLAHPELSAESPGHGSGTYALMDQIAALQWVQTNISRFAGDPRNVTISGQSAGGYSVAALMTAPSARGLFAKAAMLSGTALDDTPVQPTLREAEASGATFVAGLGGRSVADLRQRSAQQLIDAMAADPALRKAEPRTPVVDGDVLPEQPGLVFRAGREAPVPLLVGATARDGDFDAMGVTGTPKAAASAADPARPLALTHNPAPLAAEGTQAVAAFYAAYPDLAAEAAKVYAAPGLTRPVDGDTIWAFQTDVTFRCGAALTARWHARVAPTWRYEFSHGYEPLGAVHLWDLAYLFGWRQPPADQPRDVRLTDQIQLYWTNFARTGSPNARGLPVWPQSKPKPGAGAYLDFASDGAVGRTGPRTAACDLFAAKVERDLAALTPTGR
ncbi:carboxylesterase/lipase family protein [Phenylobacterium aquaticum]|uniref:carboxylesterase/lipase family protein n=1 Tax=Phenylobacterium aquaticum TaxID=1763816 RepID=UPI0026EE40E9|nr:carboxylesterase family protein [Phenylobacterium aquaticum]